MSTTSRLRPSTDAFERLLARSGRLVELVAERAHQPAGAWARGRVVLSTVSALGWAVLASSVGCWVLGRQLGWVEMMLLATAALTLFACCALLTIGRTRVRIEVTVEPQRVRVGQASAGRLRVTSTAHGPMLPFLLELPVGTGTARYDVPLLRPGGLHEELFVVGNERRGVIPIGPATTVRGDPLGLLRRTVRWSGVIELFVHPVTVPLEPLGSGLLRDLEGRSTQDTSMSDLAFHTLREYQPGDDRRYIHWRSSAKVFPSDDGRFLVRQFLDTRRTHLTTIVDAAAESYVDEDDYETAISVAASLAIRTVLDEQELSVVAGEHAITNAAGSRVLDVFSRAEFGGQGLTPLTARASRMAPQTTMALLVTGPLVPVTDLLRAASHFSQGVEVVALRVDPGASTGVDRARGLTVLTVRTLRELPALLGGTLS